MLRFENCSYSKIIQIINVQTIKETEKTGENIPEPGKKSKKI
jgi:hypothetical protein